MPSIGRYLDLTGNKTKFPGKHQFFGLHSSSREHLLIIENNQRNSLNTFTMYKSFTEENPEENTT